MGNVDPTLQSTECGLDRVSSGNSSGSDELVLDRNYDAGEPRSVVRTTEGELRVRRAAASKVGRLTTDAAVWLSLELRGQ